MPYIKLEGLITSATTTTTTGGGGVKRGRGDVANEEHLTRLLNNAHLRSLDQSNVQQEQGGGPSMKILNESDTQNNDDVEESKPKSSAVWKRLSVQEEDNEEEGQQNYRIINALLEEEEEERATKRRKLTLLDDASSSASSPTKKKKSEAVRRKKPLKILDPLTRLVDDSLQQVHAGSKQISEHYQFCVTDSRLLTGGGAKRWLTWCHSTGANLLHACALWNDVEMTNELCQSSTMCGALTEALDGDDRTPYEVAQLSGHDSVCQVLEAYGGDTTNFVYDIFCLDEHSVKSDDDDVDPMTVELKGGVGYWTPDGELILEAPDKAQSSLDRYYDDDGEIDSNCEEYGGNDYPEEDELDWNDDFAPIDHGFRDYPTDL